MSFSYVPFEVPFSLMTDEKLNVEKIQCENPCAQMSPFTIIYKQNKTTLQVISLLQLELKNKIEDICEIVDFTYLKSQEHRNQQCLDIIAYLTLEGQVKIYSIAMNNESLTIQLLNQIQIQYYKPSHYKIIFEKQNVLVLHDKFTLIIFKGDLLSSQDHSNIQKQIQNIDDVKVSANLKIIFVLSQNRVNLFDFALNSLRDITLNEENTKQLILLDNKNFNLDNNLEGNQNFLTLTSNGLLTLWNMGKYNNEEKTYIKQENLHIFSEKLQPQFLIDHPQFVHSRVNLQRDMLIIMGKRNDTDLIYFFIKFNREQKTNQTRDEQQQQESHFFSQIKTHVEHHTSIPNLLIQEVSPNSQGNYFANVEQDTIAQIQEFQKNGQVEMYYYLLATLQNDSISFHWMVQEDNQENTQQEIFSTDQVPIYEEQQEQQLSNNQNNQVHVQIIEKQERELQQDPKTLYEEFYSGHSVQSPDDTTETTFLNQLIRDIAEDPELVQMINKNLFPDQEESIIDNNGFSSQLQQIESDLETHLTNSLDQILKDCEDIITDQFSQEKLGQFIDQAIEQKINRNQDYSQQVVQVTDDYLNNKVLPLYQQELTSLTQNVIQSFEKTIQYYKDQDVIETIKLKTYRDLLQDIREQIKELISVVNKQNVKQLNDTNTELNRIWQKFHDLSTTCESLTKKTFNFQQIPQTQSLQQPQIINPSQGMNFSSTITQLSQLQQQLAQPSSVNLKTLHQIISQLIAQLSLHMTYQQG